MTITIRIVTEILVKSYGDMVAYTIFKLSSVGLGYIPELYIHTLT